MLFSTTDDFILPSAFHLLVLTLRNLEVAVKLPLHCCCNCNYPLIGKL